ncbi:MAG: 1-acyl-sn-glycerol-3-phosphate acyltransferase, partial [Treponema sp.]|nr:1-acyl-sn-glycerol-3-phosphate acyltransferase [Treponema sp.]
MGTILKEKYGQYFAELLKISKAASKIDESKVYEEANLESRKYLYSLMTENLQKGSGLNNVENFKSFYESVTKDGKRGLILMEHYTNLDLPLIIYLLENQGEEWAKNFASRIVAVAGMKLNESNPAVRA